MKYNTEGVSDHLNQVAGVAREIRTGWCTANRLDSKIDKKSRNVYCTVRDPGARPQKIFTKSITY